MEHPDSLQARQQDSMRPSELLAVTAKVMADFRTRWAGMIIRRTVNTKTADGSPINGLPPMHEKFVMLRLSDEEQKWMNIAAENTSEGTAGVRRAATDKVRIPGLGERNGRRGRTPARRTEALGLAATTPRGRAAHHRGTSLDGLPSLTLCSCRLST